MSWFSSKKPEPAASNPPTANVPSTSPGAEQDRYASHFSIGKEGLDKVKDAAVQAATYKGEGAEQDRYATHFSPDHNVVREAAASLLKAKATSTEPNWWGFRFGLGADGWERAKRLAFVKGDGAEQDRFASHFSVDHDSIQRAASSIQDGVKDGINRVTR